MTVGLFCMRVEDGLKLKDDYIYLANCDNV